MAAILCLDFDDVIVEGDLTRAVLDHFAAGWRELEAAYERGESSVEQMLQWAFERVEATREEIEEFTRAAARPRPGLAELAAWCDEHGWLPMMLSHSFDFAVACGMDDPALRRVARHAGQTRFAYRWRLSYFSPRGVELQGGFQLSYLAALRQAGDFVALVSGAATAAEAEDAANVVFARPGRGDGPRKCREWLTLEGIPALLAGTKPPG